MSKIISVVNQKGGVGKTTISINLAAGLARHDHSTLLIDMDPQANATQGIAIEPLADQGIHAVLSFKQSIDDAIINTQVNNLHLLPSHLDLGIVEKQLTSQVFRETQLQKIITPLQYDFIIIDCGPDLDNLAINAIYTSHLILVPLDMSKFSLAGLSNVMDTINKIKNGQVTYDITRILLNKYDLRKKGFNDWYMNQLQDYQDMILKTIIKVDSSTEHAHSSEVPIFTFKPTSRAAEDFTHLTKEILDLCHQ